LAALLLITAAGVVLFLIVSLIARATLRGWHESELGREA
jgi:ABC-type nitrate/sulfonate/bicarbonate transport system permease component